MTNVSKNICCVFRLVYVMWKVGYNQNMQVYLSVKMFFPPKLKQI